jgi:DNA polymerase alpha subunit A
MNERAVLTFLSYPGLGRSLISFAGKSTKELAMPKAKAKPKPPPPVANPSISAYRPKKTAEEEDEFMNSLLSGIDKIPIASSSRARKRKPSPQSAYSRSAYRDTFGDQSSDGPPSDGFDLAADASSDGDFMDVYASPRKKTRHDAHDVGPMAGKLSQVRVSVKTEDEDEYDSAFQDDDLAAYMDVDMPTRASAPPPAAAPKTEPTTEKKPEKKENEGPPAWLSVYDSLAVASDEAFGSLGTGSTSSSSSAGAARIKALQPDGAFHFFWMDYLEHEGMLYFVGKTRDQATGAYVSCCVTVGNLERNLFVLPRPFQLAEDGAETDVTPGVSEVFQDFDAVRQKAGIKKWKGRFVKRKYAFGEIDVPKVETQWMKVVYGFNGAWSPY